ncbi:tetraspanin 34a isoform X2 [Trichomycterus rosablanca]|uniref:tetraspanin 34a isoform X2 n=1 Tax=Trichomycterus rosablanca TaxID=2290929 RepID=UPI002F352DF7
MCCAGFLKIMMFIFNGVIFLAGGTILGVGIWVTVDSSSIVGVLSQIKDAPPELAQLANVGYLLIAVGSILALMGFLGCCGAVTESKCMLLTFFIIVLIIFIAEVAGAIVVLVFKPLADELLTSLNQKFVENIKSDYGQDDSFTTVLNNTMIQLKCCGYNNYTDFDGSPFVESTKNYPPTCCGKTSLCDSAEAEAKDVQGCFNALVKLIEDNAVLLGGVALGIAALEIAAMVVSMTLYNNVGKQLH